MTSSICPNGHSYQARVNNRIHGRSCPYCAGKKVLKGFNDLDTISPILASEWDYEKNDITPTEITTGSHRKVWWKCICGESFLKSPHERMAGRGCPKCGKRVGSSFPEQCIFFYIKKQFPDAVNREQSILGNKMELDIYIPRIKTGIEYDGAAWHTPDKYVNEKK